MSPEALVAAKEHPAFGLAYGLSLDEAEKYLMEGEPDA